MTISIPICFYPMQKIVLDDDHAFSQSILLKMHGKNFTAYNSPKEMLHYLLNEYRPTFTKFDLIDNNTPIADSSTQHFIGINLDKLKKMLSYSHHQDISVLLVDYHMPEMRGVDFLKEISHLPFKKALITGEKDYKIAVDAFNAGLVDAYIRKDDSDFFNKVQNTVTELEWKYFTEMSNFILDTPDFSYLKNVHFIEVFNRFIQDNHIKAFCLTHTQGNFIAQNIQNEQKHILIRNLTQLRELSKIAEEDGGSSETINNLRDGKVIPFFGDMNHWQIPANDWDEFLYPATRLVNDSNLIWTVIDTQTKNPIDT